MIEVFIVKNGEPLAHIEIINDGTAHRELSGTEYADYRVRFGIDRGTAVGVHSRRLYLFPRNRLNVLALVRQALNLLDEKELSLEPGYDPDSNEAAVPQALAGRLRGTVREIQRGFSRLYRN